MLLSGFVKSVTGRMQLGHGAHLPATVAIRLFSPLSKAILMIAVLQSLINTDAQSYLFKTASDSQAIPIWSCSNAVLGVSPALFCT